MIKESKKMCCSVDTVSLKQLQSTGFVVQGRWTMLETEILGLSVST